MAILTLPAGRRERPPSAFDYINGNYILSAWRGGLTASLACRATAMPSSPRKGNCLADGFTHVVFHRYWRGVASESKTLLYLPAAYEDDYMLIFRVRDLDLNCGSTGLSAERAAFRRAARRWRCPAGEARFDREPARL